MRKMRRTIIVLRFLLIMITILSGCGSAEKQGDKQTEAADQVEAAEQTEAVDKTEAAQSAETVGEPLYPADQKSCIIQEDESYIYVCSVHRLVKIDKVTGESVILWENANLSDDENMYVYSEGSGLLVNDKIYFVEAWTEDTGGGSATIDLTAQRALAVIRKDGTGYERVAELTGNSISMLLQDEILYVHNWHEGVICYKVFADGTLSEAVNREVILSKEYVEASYNDNGYRILFPSESRKKFGSIILWHNYGPVKVTPETGEQFDMSQFGRALTALRAFNSRCLLISSHAGTWLVDAETMEGREFADCFRIDVITMDEDYVYTESEISEEGQARRVYEKISLKTGERSAVFTQEERKIRGDDLIDTVVKNGYLYYVGEADYKLYLMRRNLDDPSKEEILGEAFYDSGISEVGSMEVYHESISKEGRFSEQKRGTRAELIIDINLKWLQVDDRFPGAAAINEYLAEDQRQNIAYEKGWLEDLITDDEEKEPEDGEEETEAEEWTYHFSYTSDLSEISYFDDHYLSFCQAEYDYQSGAHGMPCLIGYTFDLQTGDRLVLEDVIANSEEELKDIVTRYFEEMIMADAMSYWDDAPDTVRERTDLESSFYLTERGIRFYFGPYVLAPFGQGFQAVTIPYEEFEIKIPVGNPPQ